MSSRDTRFRPSARHLNASNFWCHLPPCLSQYILFRMPLEDAIKMSCVSKDWLDAWTSLPDRIFHFDPSNAYEDMTLEEHVNSFDESLSLLKQTRAFIYRFSLIMDLSQEQGLGLVSTRFDEWMSLILKNYVREIEIRISKSLNNYVFLNLPQALFASRSLIKLHLEGCCFPFPMFDDENMIDFNCLRELTLVNVLATQEEVQNLVNLSRKFLEKLVVKLCPFANILDVSHFENLRELEVNLMELEIESLPKLHTLVMYEIWEVTCYDCPNITKLCCLGWEPHDGFMFIQELIQTLPLLETLHMFLSHDEKMKVESDHLESLILSDSRRFTDEALEIELETPRLRKVYFSGIRIPFVKVGGVLSEGDDDENENENEEMVNNNNVNDDDNETLELHHLGHPTGGIAGSCLHELGKFSEHFNHPCVKVYLHRIFTQDLLSLEELKQHGPCVYDHSSNVEALVLECIPATHDFTTFLNCLFWSCHPKSLELMLTSEETISSPFRNAFLAFLQEELVLWEEKDDDYDDDDDDDDDDDAFECCPEADLSWKCWKHYLKEVKCSVYRMSDEGELIDISNHLSQINGMSFTDNNHGFIIEFGFKWSSFAT